MIDLTTVGMVVVAEEPVVVPEEVELVVEVAEAVLDDVVVLAAEAAVVVDAEVVLDEEAAVVAEEAVIPDGPAVPDAVPLVVVRFVGAVAAAPLVVDAAEGDCDESSPEQALSDSTDMAEIITTAARIPLKTNLPLFHTTQDSVSCRLRVL